MYNPIEIPDSEDDMSGPAEDIENIKVGESEMDEQTAEKRRKISNSSTAEATGIATTYSTFTDATGTNNNASTHVQSQSQVRHRARKTQHTVRNAAENEIEFETIQLDDESCVGELTKTDPPEPPLTGTETLNAAINKMMNTDELKEIVQRIANERVRCNFLLATYHLPDMNFTLNTPVEMLKFQFQERLKKRRERSNVFHGAGPRTAGSGNPHTLLKKKK